METKFISILIFEHGKIHTHQILVEFIALSFVAVTTIMTIGSCNIAKAGKSSESNTNGNHTPSQRQHR